MRKAKGNIRKMLPAIVLTLLCGSVFAQRIVESGDLRTTTTNSMEQSSII